MSLKQTFVKEAKQVTRRADGYAHAKQFRRMRKVINRQRTIVGRLSREIERQVAKQITSQVATLSAEFKGMIKEALLKAQRLMTQTKHRGVDQDNPGVRIKHRGKYKSLTEQERKLLKRRQTIEPIFGHLKSDNRMNRCHLKGPEGDWICPRITGPRVSVN